MNYLMFLDSNFTYTTSDLVITFALLGFVLYAGWRFYRLLKDFKHD